ncbi:hypothetical protein [Thalassotalea sp. G2M2-11]|uniref:hypothetical protein n=1 Tax=Thalassotalea sp. G2M2-11 TaxID=2787627 RepID=UPI0019D08B79|nr:hypothetical protein [Thalassotalea sp. G2M2-11]
MLINTTKISLLIVVFTFLVATNFYQFTENRELDEDLALLNKNLLQKQNEVSAILNSFNEFKKSVDRQIHDIKALETAHANNENIKQSNSECFLEPDKILEMAIEENARRKKEKDKKIEEERQYILSELAMYLDQDTHSLLQNRGLGLLKDVYKVNSTSRSSDHSINLENSIVNELYEHSNGIIEQDVNCTIEGCVIRILIKKDYGKELDIHKLIRKLDKKLLGTSFSKTTEKGYQDFNVYVWDRG